MAAAGDVSGEDSRQQGIDRIVALVLRDPPEFTREQAAGAAGLSVDQARSYWRAMGFADVGSEPSFTAMDVESLRQLVEWIDTGAFDEATTIEVVRSLGQTASRLAEWQVGTMARILGEAGAPVDLDALGDGLAGIMPGLESMLVHAWRRHLAAAIGRGLVPIVEESTSSTEPVLATVGFADIAGFTRLARAMGDDQLAAMVQAFETGAADIIASHGSRLVKTMGDEVMFVASTPDDALAMAEAMHTLPAPGPEPLSLRIGLATGQVVSRMGDVYGGTVNRASRLTDVARPGSTLIDTATEEALSDRTAYQLRHLAPRPLRGLGLVRPTSVVRRAR